MKYQKLTFSCGPAAIVNALRVFGKRVAEARVRKFTNTTKENGTDEFGVMAGLSGLGFSYHQYNSSSRQEAVNWLTGAISNSQPVILCVDNHSHWITIIGKVGDRFILIDSANTQANIKENGTHVVSLKQLTYRWRSKDKDYYGIAVKKK